MAIYKGTGQNRKKIAENNVQSDWNEENTNSSTFIKNKPNFEEIINTKQNILISGTNIKTINNESILGSGNIEIQGGGGLPPLNSLRSGKYLYKANDSNRPISSVNEDQTVLVLSNYYADTTDIAIITTKRIDFEGKLWVTGRWSTNNYLTPIEVTDSTIRNYFNEIIKLNPTNFKHLAPEGQNLMSERSENIMAGYDWVSANRPFSMYRQGCFLIFKETIVNTTYSAREAFIIGYGSQGISSWGGTQKVGIRYKPSGSTTWGNETLF